jgi:cation/acetate symporter
MRASSKLVLGAALALCGVSLALAAGADLGQAEKQATNWTAIGMFGVFVLLHAVHHQVGRGQDQERG